MLGGPGEGRSWSTRNERAKTNLKPTPTPSTHSETKAHTPTQNTTHRHNTTQLVFCCCAGQWWLWFFSVCLRAQHFALFFFLLQPQMSFFLFSLGGQHSFGPIVLGAKLASISHTCSGQNRFRPIWPEPVQDHFGPMLFDFVFDVWVSQILGRVQDLWVPLGPRPLPLPGPPFSQTAFPPDCPSPGPHPSGPGLSALRAPPTLLAPQIVPCLFCPSLSPFFFVLVPLPPPLGPPPLGPHPSPLLSHTSGPHRTAPRATLSLEAATT